MKPEVAGLALLAIPVLNGFGLVLFLTWINFYRKTKSGVALILSNLFLAIFLSFELVYEFSGISRDVGGFLQLFLAIGNFILSMSHVASLRRSK